MGHSCKIKFTNYRANKIVGSNTSAGLKDTEWSNCCNKTSTDPSFMINANYGIFFNQKTQGSQWRL